ncbi:MAG: MFS transporter [Candidatus Binatia bacterium]
MTIWKRVIAYCLAEVLGMVGFATFPALIPTFIDKWQLTHTEAGWISGIYFAGYMGAVPVLVSLTDRADPRRIYLISVALGAVSALGYALLADGFWSAFVFRTLAGIGLAGTYMPGLKALTDLVKGPRQSRVLAFYTSSFSIGAAVSFYISGEVAGWLGWRWSFGVASLASLASLIIVIWTIPPASGDRCLLPETRLLDFRPVLRNPTVMGYIIAYGAHIWELFGQRSWIVTFLSFSRSLQPVGAGTLIPATVVAALVNLAGVPASIAGNEMALRFGRVRLVTSVMILSALISSVIGFSASLPYLLVALSCLFHGMAAYGDSSAITAGLVAAAEPRFQGAAMAVHSFVGFGCGFLGPLAFGIVLDLAPGGQNIAWGLAFASLGLAGAMGPVALAMLVRSRG